MKIFTSWDSIFVHPPNFANPIWLNPARITITLGGPQALCVPELVATALLGGEPLTLIWGKSDNFGVKSENADF